MAEPRHGPGAVAGVVVFPPTGFDDCIRRSIDGDVVNFRPLTDRTLSHDEIYGTLRCGAGEQHGSPAGGLVSDRGKERIPV